MVHTILSLAVASVITLASPQEPGTRLLLYGTVRDAAGRPVPSASVHIYQTDASGRYTPDKPMDEPHARLSAQFLTDTQGSFEVQTIRPGGYQRAVTLAGVQRHIPAHIHIDVTASGHPERRVQVVFADDPNLKDSYWQHWASSLKQPIVTPELRGKGIVANVIVVLE